MNKQLIAAMTSVAMIASSCVSTQKTESRNVASVQTKPEVVAIVTEGFQQQQRDDEQQKILKAKGGNVNFASAPFMLSNLTDADLKKYSAGYDVKIRQGQVITDNDIAFQQKLRVIKNANQTLRMVYFIYADDQSSSVLNSALIAKANEPQFKEAILLVDFITNYKNLDLFTALSSATNGKIKTFFYNFPNNQIFSDANYITMPCPKDPGIKGDECYQDKMNKMTPGEKVGADKTAFSKLLLTGIYGKSAVALKVALGSGAQINPADYKNVKSSPEIDGEALLDLAQTVSEAFVQGSIVAKIKLSIAMAMYGEKINPLLNELTGRLPLRDMANNDSKDDKKVAHGAVWDHLTDYTHHKLVLADEEEFVMGGRNVEDSYHMKQHEGGSAKYTFMDTDFWGKTDRGGAASIRAAFDRLAGSRMVASLQKVKLDLAFDFLANTGAKGQIGASQMAVGHCSKTQPDDIAGCIMRELKNMPGYISEDARVSEVRKDMQKGYDAYKSYTQTAVADFPVISDNDMKQAKFFYLENMNTDKDDKRIQGSRIGSEDKNNKNIQAVWYRALQNVCKVSKDTNTEKRVIFNTAYLLMPSGLIHSIAQMMNNDFRDCSRVTITFITNSPFTTDLAPINVLARYQLGALFDHYKQLIQIKTDFEKAGYVPGAGEGASGGSVKSFTYRQFWPKLEYYEYGPTTIQQAQALAQKPQSLHTKTTLIGDDLIVGSANADVRSYLMDTNNAMMIRNAKELNERYIAFVDNLIRTKTVHDRLADFQGQSFETLSQQNAMFLAAGAARWKQETRLTPERSKILLKYIDDAGRKIYDTTKELLVYRGTIGGVEQTEGPRNNRYNGELNDKANRMDGLFKVF